MNKDELSRLAVDKDIELDPAKRVDTIPRTRLKWIRDSTNMEKVAIAVFFVAIMIGAAFFVSFHHLPEDEDVGEGPTLHWDMNIYKHPEANCKYRGSGLYLTINFPEELRHSDVRLKNADVSLSYGIIDLLWGKNNGESIDNAKGIVDGNRITYPDVFVGVDLEFRVGINGLKEYIVLKEPPRYLSGDLIVRSQFSYPPSSLEPAVIDTEPTGGKISTDDTISMLNSKGEEVLRVAPPYAYDSSDILEPTVRDSDRAISLPIEDTPVPMRRAVNGTHTIEENAEGASYAIRIPYEFLSSTSTKYPVYIDPSISGQIDDDQWFSDVTIELESNLDIVSGGSLNIHESTLNINSPSENGRYIDVASGAQFNFFNSFMEPVTAYSYDLRSSGAVVIQDSTIKLTYDGLRVLDGTASLRSSVLQDAVNDGMDVVGADSVTLYETEIKDSGAVGLRASSADIDVLKSEIHDNGDTGVTISGCTGQISETEVHTNSLDGIAIVNSEIDVVESTIRDNQGHGLIISASSGTVFGMKIHDNDYGVLVEDGADPLLVENEIYSNDYHGVIISGAEPTLNDNHIHDHV